MKKAAFTLAEILITLAIIGVVSALVIPTVLKNYNDKKYNTARLKALKTFGEAGKMASINGEINGQPSARAFVENVLSKYLKIIKVCDNANPTDCNFPDKIQPLDPSASKIKVNANSFATWSNLARLNYTCKNYSPTSDKTMSTIVAINDGFSAKIFYNPNCAKNVKEYSAYIIPNRCPTYNMDITCMNVIYDMNGIKGPNQVGKDIGFVTTFYSGLNTVSASPGLIPYETAKAIFDVGKKTQPDAQKLCADNGLILPSINELSSIHMNDTLTSVPYSYNWSGSCSSSSCSGVDVAGYYRASWSVSINFGVWCVRR